MSDLDKDIESESIEDGKLKKGKGQKMVFRLWPTPDEGKPYGPSPKQKLLFIEDLPLNPIKEQEFYRRPHLHPVDVVLYIGGARSGKSLSATARVIKYLLDNPGAIAIVGAENRPLLWRSAVKIWQERFTYQTPWDHLKLKNKLITRKPSMNEPRIDFTNGSVVYFLHFSDPEILKGIDASVINFEEADLLRDEATFEELLARLSGKKGPIRQLILTTNPVRASKGWIRDKFKLWQNHPDYKGEIEPIVKPCSCNLCQACINGNQGEWKFTDPEGNESTIKGSKCSNPNCAKIQLYKEVDPTRAVCEIKDNDCPGNQVFYRVIQTASTDNIHIPTDYAQSASRGMSKETAAAMVRGEIVENKDGLVYQAFCEENVLKTTISADLNKDLVWTLDFNYDPQCSVVCQESETLEGFSVNVIDEIILWNSLPEHAAKEFCQRYHAFKYTDRNVYIYSDPAGLWGGGTDLKPTFYQTIIDILRKKTNEFGEIDEVNGKAFNIKVMMKRDAENRGKLKIPVAGRIDSVNSLLKNDLGEVRLFINPKCRYLISSFEGCTWDNTGQNVNKNIDIYAKRRNKEIVRPMTHPTEALGYYIYKRFPLLKNKKGITVFHVPGESSITYSEGRITEQRREDRSGEILEAKRLKKEERKKDREDKRSQRESRKNSIGSIIDSYRMGSFFNRFF